MDSGTLFVVTYKGGSLGREGKHHTVLIPDVNVSKNHLKLSYNKKYGNYQIIDHSRNGTIVDGKQISSMNQEDSEAIDLFHDNIIQISNTKLLCHVHEGLTTCKDCEPFNYAKPQKEPEKVIEDPQPSNLSHKEQLKLLQKRYGLQSEKYLETPSSGKNKNYEDRAENRRVKVGSSHHAEKTVQASVDTSISSDNKGFKMLSKMGWSEGKSIGKSQEGIKEPVQLKSQQGTSGLGNESIQLLTTPYNAKKKAILDKTQQRYNNINENIFED
jgi:predicted component of type VI protein secretion system